MHLSGCSCGDSSLELKTSTRWTFRRWPLLQEIDCFVVWWYRLVRNKWFLRLSSVLIQTSIHQIDQKRSETPVSSSSITANPSTWRVTSNTLNGLSFCSVGFSLLIRWRLSNLQTSDPISNYFLSFYPYDHFLCICMIVIVNMSNDNTSGCSCQRSVEARSVQFTVYGLQFTVHGLHFTVNISQLAVHDLQFTSAGGDIAGFLYRDMTGISRKIDSKLQYKYWNDDNVKTVYPGSSTNKKMILLANGIVLENRLAVS